MAQQEAQRAAFFVEKAYQERQQKIVQAEGEAEAAKMISFSTPFTNEFKHRASMMILGLNELSESWWLCLESLQVIVKADIEKDQTQLDTCVRKGADGDIFGPPLKGIGLAPLSPLPTFSY